MDGFDVTENWFERVVVVTPVGEIDILTAPGFSDAIDAARRQEPSAMILDLTKVTLLASAGINLLLTAHQEVSRHAQFGVVAEGSRTFRPLHLTGIDTVMAIYGLLAAALDAVADS
jgi:anti-sigma B factor antagonist